MADITSIMRSGAVADTTFPLSSKAGASTCEWERTSVVVNGSVAHVHTV
jgi:hypothetical protein